MGDLTKIDSIPQLLPLVNAKSDAELFADLDATAAFAKAQGGDANRLGVIGLLYAGHNPALKAGVSFYGSLMDPPSEAMPQNAFDLADAVKAPVLGLYGAEDQGIPPDQVRQMEARLQAAGKTAEFKIYPGAPHGFFADYRASYRKEAAEDAWRRADRLVQDLWRARLNARAQCRPAQRRLKKDGIECSISAGIAGARNREDIASRAIVNCIGRQFLRTRSAL
jgi:dienelactone hydrolase